jgi:two-component system nitrogen regulation response regulator GlnG
MLCTTGPVVDTESLPPYILENGNIETEHSERESVERTRELAFINHSSPSIDISETNGHTVFSEEPQVAEDFDSLENLQKFIEMRMGEGSENLYAESIEELERFLFRRVLSHTGGNQSKAALMLGITRGKVRDRIAKFELPA